VQVGEDGEFVEEARAHGAIASVDAGDLMYATVWSGNTSPRRLTDKRWQQIDGWP
jgi:hypothetical protein